ncbi:MAG TPA: transketolase [Acidimicrobiales bacterium]|nr:transketolase [Acidimicrobiales bacterium]
MVMDLQAGYEALPELLSLMSGDEKHDPAALSTLDTIWVLYDRVLDISPERVDDPARDRFLLSKGHGPQAYYAVLAAKGYVGAGELATFGAFESPFGYHPDRLLIPGVEISSGSLGHGLAIAVGLALGLGIRSGGTGGEAVATPRVFCLLGDAELDEGSNHEAIALAGRLGLDRLTAVVIDNDSSSYGWPGGVEQRFAGEGWDWRRTMSRDHSALAEALGAPPEHGRPRVVVVGTDGKANGWRSLQLARSAGRPENDARGGIPHAQ